MVPLRSTFGPRPLPIIALAALALLVGCSSGGSQSKAPVNVGVIAPFTGTQAFVGQFFGQACDAAAYVVDQAGGVLHRQMHCVQVDNTGDPADAGPNVAKALATDSNLDLAVCLDSGTAAVTVPLVEHANLTLFTLNGLSQYDNNANPYFWRVEPDDTNEGAALAAYAHQRAYGNVAVVFENLGSAQSEVTGTSNGLKALGIHTAISLTIPSNAVSYAS